MQVNMKTKWMSTTTGYGWLSISMHWLMLILIVATYATMDLKTLFPKGSPARESMAMWHYMLGLSVFCFVWLRVGARLFGDSPAVVPEMPVWQKLLSKAVHFAIYAL